jgi:cytochrome c peroxidase
LRNVALTAPYMHDGSVATLAEVVVHYARGGRNWATPTGGRAARNPHQSAVLGGFALDLDEQRALVAFLESLTDEAFVRDPRFADPGELP